MVVYEYNYNYIALTCRLGNELSINYIVLTSGNALSMNIIKLYGTLVWACVVLGI